MLSSDSQPSVATIALSSPAYWFSKVSWCQSTEKGLAHKLLIIYCSDYLYHTGIPWVLDTCRSGLLNWREVLWRKRLWLGHVWCLHSAPSSLQMEMLIEIHCEAKTFGQATGSPSIYHRRQQSLDPDSTGWNWKAPHLISEVVMFEAGSQRIFPRFNLTFMKPGDRRWLEMVENIISSDSNMTIQAWWFWVNHFVSLGLGFLICETRAEGLFSKTPNSINTQMSLRNCHTSQVHKAEVFWRNGCWVPVSSWKERVSFLPWSHQSSQSMGCLIRSHLI